MTIFPSVVDKCCGTGCQQAFDSRPCWGEVTVVDEDWGDWGHDFVHACEGHAEARRGRYQLPVLREADARRRAG